LWGKSSYPDTAIIRQGGSGFVAEYAIVDTDTDSEGKLVVKTASLPKGFAGQGSRSAVWNLYTCSKNVSTLNDTPSFSPITASIALNVGVSPVMPTAAQLMNVLTQVYTFTFAKLAAGLPDPTRIAQALFYLNAGVMGWSPT